MSDRYLSLEFLNGNNIEEQQAIAYANIGEVYMDQGYYQEALDWLDKALVLLTDNSDNRSVIGIYNVLGECYFLREAFDKSSFYLEEAIKVANKDIINEPFQKTLKLIRNTYRKLNEKGQTVSSTRYDNILKLDEIQDSLEEELMEKANFRALQAALGLSIELDNAMKQKEAEMESKEFYINLTLVLVILIVIVAVYLIYRLKKMYMLHRNFRRGLEAKQREALYVLENWNQIMR